MLINLQIVSGKQGSNARADWMEVLKCTFCNSENR